jgi:ABC-type uncharacterized transport system permease subunit
VSNPLSFGGYRLIRRVEVSRSTSILVTSLGLGMAFLAAGLLFISVGVNPLAAYGSILQSFANPVLMGVTIERATPLLLAALGLAVAFRLNFWNIGSLGQMYLGAIAGTGLVTLAATTGFHPSFALLPLMIVLSFVFGAAFGAIPAVLKTKLGVNEILSTLMLNFIANYFSNYLVFGPWLDPGAHGFPNSRIYPPEALFAQVPFIGSNSSLVLAIGIAVVVYLIMKRSTFGYELKVTGDSPKASRYSGMSYTAVVVIAMVISGGLSGVAGMTYLSGKSGVVTMKADFLGNLGYTAIIVAWLGGLNPVVTVVASLLFGGLLVSGDTLQINLNLSASTTSVFQALVLIFVLVSESLKRYAIVWEAKV